MKRRIALLLLLLLSCFAFAGCNTNSNDPNTDSGVYFNLDIEYLQYLSADLSDANALGIKKDQKQAVQAKTMNLIADVDETNQEEQKYYLYKTTEDYNNGTAEYNENGLTKVVFQKNTTVTEDVYDSEGRLIKSNSTITQDEIPAQVNKFLISHGKTFIQFIPVISESGNYNYIENNEIKSSYISLRPDDDDMSVDDDGNFIFDTEDYFSDALHQSFVIDNVTGYIYKIEGIHIDLIKNGLIKADADGLVYDMKIDEDGNLNFFSLFTFDMNVSNYFKDKFGNNYIINDSIDQFDSNTNTVFSQKEHYYMSAEKQVLYSNFFEYLYGCCEYQYADEAYLIGDNMAHIDISSGTNLNFSLDFNGVHQGHSKLSHIQDGIIYLYHNDTIVFGSAGMTGLYKIDSINKRIDNYNFTMESYSQYCSFFIKYDTVLFAQKNGANIDLYYRQIFFDERDDDISTTNGSHADDLHKETLLVNCKFDIEDIADKTTCAKYMKITLEKTFHYIVTFDESNNVVLIEDVVDAKEQKVISLQPINR